MVNDCRQGTICPGRWKLVQVSIFRPLSKETVLPGAPKAATNSLSVLPIHPLSVSPVEAQPPAKTATNMPTAVQGQMFCLQFILQPFKKLQFYVSFRPFSFSRSLPTAIAADRAFLPTKSNPADQ